MKRFLKKIFFLLLFSAVIYSLYSMVFRINEKEIAAVYDSRYDKVIKYSDKPFFIVPEAVVPDRITVLKIRSSGAKSFPVKVNLPELEYPLSSDYSISFTISLTYDLLPDKLYLKKDDFSSLKIESIIKSNIENYYSLYLNKFNKKYSKVAILKFLTKNEPVMLASFKKIMLNQGIKIDLVEKIGTYSLPGEDVYRSAILFKNKINALKQDQLLELKEFKQKLKKRNLKDDYNLKRLEKYSKIIKDNPDILKYIYIDKLGGNVKMILPLNSSGYPLDLNGVKSKSQNLLKNREIDNLK